MSFKYFGVNIVNIQLFENLVTEHQENSQTKLNGESGGGGDSRGEKREFRGRG